MSAFNDSEICRSILESLPTGLCVVDIHNRILFWSSGAERLTGRLRHDVVGHCCTDDAFLHCGQPAGELCKQECPLARAMKSAQPAEALVFLQHKAGREIPVRARAVPVRNVHGSIIGAVETFEDQPSFAIDYRHKSMHVSDATDEITGISNRTSMQSHLREALCSFTETQLPFGVLCFRIEGLDRFRASFGLEAGSALLRVLAQTLRSALWQTDFVGRWSDDQFLVILNACREDALQSVRERLGSMLANQSIEWWGERRSLQISVGQAMLQAGDTADSLMLRAQNFLPAASAMGHAASSSGGSSDSGSK